MQLRCALCATRGKVQGFRILCDLIGCEMFSNLFFLQNSPFIVFLQLFQVLCLKRGKQVAKL